MGSLFLKSRMNWIFWILFLNLLMLGISLIDYDFPIDSFILYCFFEFKFNNDFSYIDIF